MGISNTNYSCTSNLFSYITLVIMYAQLHLSALRKVENIYWERKVAWMKWNLHLFLSFWLFIAMYYTATWAHQLGFGTNELQNIVLHNSPKSNSCSYNNDKCCQAAILQLHWMFSELKNSSILNYCKLYTVYEVGLCHSFTCAQITVKLKTIYISKMF